MNLATFRGAHNKRKALALLALTNFGKSGLNYESICFVTAANRESLRVLLIRWHKWDLVRVRVEGADRYQRFYVISQKGLKWLNNNLLRMPYDEWLHEIPEHLKQTYEPTFAVWQRNRDRYESCLKG